MSFWPGLCCGPSGTVPLTSHNNPPRQDPVRSQEEKGSVACQGPRLAALGLDTGRRGRGQPDRGPLWLMIIKTTPSVCQPLIIYIHGTTMESPNNLATCFSLFMGRKTSPRGVALPKTIPASQGQAGKRGREGREELCLSAPTRPLTLSAWSPWWVLYLWAEQTVSWWSGGPIPAQSGLLHASPSCFDFSAWRIILSRLAVQSYAHSCCVLPAWSRERKPWGAVRLPQE